MPNTMSTAAARAISILSVLSISGMKPQWYLNVVERGKQRFQFTMRQLPEPDAADSGKMLPAPCPCLALAPALLLPEGVLHRVLHPLVLLVEHLPGQRPLFFRDEADQHAVHPWLWGECCPRHLYQALQREIVGEQQAELLPGDGPVKPRADQEDDSFTGGTHQLIEQRLGDIVGDIADDDVRFRRGDQEDVRKQRPDVLMLLPQLQKRRPEFPVFFHCNEQLCRAQEPGEVSRACADLQHDIIRRDLRCLRDFSQEALIREKVLVRFIDAHSISCGAPGTGHIPWSA